MNVTGLRNITNITFFIPFLTEIMLGYLWFCLVIFKQLPLKIYLHSSKFNLWLLCFAAHSTKIFDGRKDFSIAAVSGISELLTISVNLAFWATKQFWFLSTISFERKLVKENEKQGFHSLAFRAYHFI